MENFVLMKQLNFIVSGLESLEKILQSEEILSNRKTKSLLVQIYSAHTDNDWYESLGGSIKKEFPTALIIGASSVGEIYQGKINISSTVILFSFFQVSELKLFSYDCPVGMEETIGEKLHEDIENLNIDVKGLLLLSNPINYDAGKMFNALTKDGINYPIFGGGAGDYDNQKKSIVYDGNCCNKQGFVAVVFYGNELYIENQTYLDWFPLSKEMEITDADEKYVRTIDGQPAFSVYERYLGIKADEKFFINSLEFPFLLNRNGHTIARTPFFANKEDGAILLVADVAKGEKFRIGYGNPQLILSEGLKIQEQIDNFRPEAIMLFSCICRRFLMQQDVDKETLPYENIAPTAGFYTFGEYFNNSTFHSLLNSTMVVVGFREGILPNGAKNQVSSTSNLLAFSTDPYSNQHTRILSRLLYFINETSKELENQNRLLSDLNEIKNEFLAIAAHDLKNPINTILGFSQLLADGLDGNQKYFANIIEEESTKMLRLLNDLLDITQIESGKLLLDKEVNEYIGFVDKLIASFEIQAQKKNIQLIRDFQFPSFSLLFAPDRMNQVLGNLLSNAIKYSHPGSVVTISIKLDNVMLVTEVIDNGQGIPEDEIDQIFKPFKRARSIPTAGESSHGLGLTIVKKIIEAHGGELGVTSKWGVGSVFFIKLPLE
jgi:signal transduction histidine kinase